MNRLLYVINRGFIGAAKGLIFRFEACLEIKIQFRINASWAYLHDSLLIKIG